MPELRPVVRSILSEVRERLAALYGDRLVRVVLYGSEARGEAGPDSDIDVLVVLRGEVNHLVAIKRMVAIKTDVLDRCGEWLSLHPYAEEDYQDRHRTSPHDERTGRRHRAMTRHQAAFFGKARQALSSAKLMLEQGDAHAAINRAYHAGFYAATAALLSKGESPKTHKGTHNRFRFHFVVDGPLDKHVAAFLPAAADARYEADYDVFSTFDQARPQTTCATPSASWMPWRRCCAMRADASREGTAEAGRGGREAAPAA